MLRFEFAGIWIVSESWHLDEIANNSLEVNDKQRPIHVAHPTSEMNPFRTFENLRCSRQHLHMEIRCCLLYWLRTRFSYFACLYLSYRRCWSGKTLLLLLSRLVRLWFCLSFHGLLGDWGWKLFRTWNTFTYHRWFISHERFPLSFVNRASTSNLTLPITYNEARSWWCFIRLNSHACSLFVVRWLIGGWLGPLIHWQRFDLRWLLCILACVVFTWHKSHFYLCSWHFRLCWVRLWWEISLHVWLWYLRFCRELLLLLRGVEVHNCELVLLMFIVLAALTTMHNFPIIPLYKESWVLNLGVVFIVVQILLIHLVVEILTADNLRLIKVLLLVMHKWSCDAKWDILRH